jgi:hypothetical protein
MSRITLNLKKQAARQAEAAQLASIATSGNMSFRRPGEGSQSYGAFSSGVFSTESKASAVPVDTYGNPWGRPKVSTLTLT